MKKREDVDLAVLLNLAFAAIKDELHAEMEKAGYDDLGSSFGYVFRLLEEKPHNLSQIAAALQITPQGAMKIVNAMVDKGYLTRSADHTDARVRWIGLTDRARAAMAQAAAFHQRKETQLALQCGSEALAVTRRVLSVLANSDGSPRPL